MEGHIERSKLLWHAEHKKLDYFYESTETQRHLETSPVTYLAKTKEKW